MDLVDTATARTADLGDVLTVAEAAKKIRVTPATVYNAIHAGEINDVICVGKKRGLRIPVTAWNEYVSSLKVA